MVEPVAMRLVAITALVQIHILVTHVKMRISVKVIHVKMVEHVAARLVSMNVHVHLTIKEFTVKILRNAILHPVSMVQHVLTLPMEHIIVNAPLVGSEMNVKLITHVTLSHV